ncbi:hypothetical protein Tco_1441874 [Tanacetum coccineum]
MAIASSSRYGVTGRQGVQLTATPATHCYLNPDMYLLIVNGKVDDYAETELLWSLSVFIRSTVIWERVHDFQLGVESYQQKVNLTALTIIFPSIEKYKVFSIVSEQVYGIICNTPLKSHNAAEYHLGCYFIA